MAVTCSAQQRAVQVNLGLLPGAQGTQRLPRVAALPVALPMILQGRPMNVARLACSSCLWQHLVWSSRPKLPRRTASSTRWPRETQLGLELAGIKAVYVPSHLFQVVEEAAAFALSHPPAPISKREVQRRQSRSLAVKMHEHVPDTITILASLSS